MPPPAAHPVYPAPPLPPPGYRPRPHYYYPRLPFYAPYYAAPFWWGWGWGYYPLYPQPEYPYLPGEADRVTSQVRITVGPTRAYWSGRRTNEIQGGAEAQIDGPRFGLGVAIDGFSLGPSYTGLGSTGTLGLGSLRATYSIASGPSGRVRAELGASVTSWPDTASELGPAALGPEIGLSGQASLVGPLGIVAHARYTPFPRYVLDFEGSLALRFGSVAVEGGWRELGVGGDSTRPSLRFTGPQFGLSFLW